MLENAIATAGVICSLMNYVIYIAAIADKSKGTRWTTAALWLATPFVTVLWVLVFAAWWFGL